MTDDEQTKLGEEELEELEDEVISTLKEGSARSTERVENKIKEVINDAVEAEN